MMLCTTAAALKSGHSNAFRNSELFQFRGDGTTGWINTVRVTHCDSFGVNHCCVGALGDDVNNHIHNITKEDLTIVAVWCSGWGFDAQASLWVKWCYQAMRGAYSHIRGWRQTGEKNRSLTCYQKRHFQSDCMNLTNQVTVAFMN